VNPTVTIFFPVTFTRWDVYKWIESHHYMFDQWSRIRTAKRTLPLETKETDKLVWIVEAVL